MMDPVKKILGKLNGLRYPQDYLCLAKESFQHPLCCYIISGGYITKDITNHHVFAGYCPLIFAIHSLNGLKLAGEITIAFSNKTIGPNEILSKKDAVALLTMKKIKEDEADCILYYEGIKGKHRFVSSFHQFTSGLNNRLYNKKPGNVFLQGNLYRQVEIAYSLPRKISLISLGENNNYNLFPTDLHGRAGKDHYIISLRHKGKACKQVEALKNIVISDIYADACKTVYGLGKNHMQELKQKNNFPFDTACSEILQLPLPEFLLGYTELQLEDSFTYGIHKLLLLKIINSKPSIPVPATLAHIHNSYATWRYNNRLGGNYLLR